jgi:hypothetical protein
MVKVYSYSWLCEIMANRKVVTVNDVRGMINGIRPEDGSGRNWLVTICRENLKGNKEVFVRAE